MQYYNTNYATYNTIVLGNPNPIFILEALILEVLKLIMKQNRDDQIYGETVKNQIRLYYKLEKIAMRNREHKFRDRWKELENFIIP